MFFLLSYMILFMITSFQKSFHRWLHFIWCANFITCLYWAFHTFNTLVISNYHLVGNIGLWTSLSFVDISFTYKILPFNFSCILLVLIISLFVQLYSIDYMYLDPFLPGFLCKLTFFSFSFILLLMTDDLFFLLLAWEAVGLSSFFLISFYNMRVRALKSSITALLYNKVGDVFLVIGISSLYTTNFSNITLFNYVQQFEETLNCNKFALVCFIVAAMSKSAQFIFHVWLPEAMEGPTPVSSLLHAATMVTAGVFLLTKIPNNASLFINELLILISSVTAFWCSFYGYSQNDIKKIIAYSTASQLAFMFMGIGMLRSDLGLFHLIEHGFFKALLFLTAGYILHSKNDEQDTRKLGAFSKLLPFPFISLLSGFANLVATPCFAGYYSKELIVTLFFIGYHRNVGNLQQIAQAFALVGVLFTCLYTIKFFYLQFLNNQQRYGNIMSTYQFNINMSISLFVLFYLSFTGLFLQNFFTSDLFILNLFNNTFKDTIFFSFLNLSFNGFLHTLPLFLFIPFCILCFYIQKISQFISVCFFYYFFDFLFGFFLVSDSFFLFKLIYSSRIIDLLLFDFSFFIDIPRSVELNQFITNKTKEYTFITSLFIVLCLGLISLISL